MLAAADKANAYRTFSAAGINWLIVAMPFLPTDGELEGANRVVKEHPDHRVIVLTHSYLTHTGRDKSGEYIWEKLVKRYRNIAMVVCGHVSTVHFVSQGDQGNKVYEMLFDWQNDKKPEPNSYLAILEFDPDAAKLSVKSYSPTLDKYLTDPRGQFEFRDVDFLKAKGKTAFDDAAFATPPKALETNPDVQTQRNSDTRGNRSEDQGCQSGMSRSSRPPAVHDMVVKLEKRGFISKEPGVPRSIRLLLKREELPDLE